MRMIFVNPARKISPAIFTTTVTKKNTSFNHCLQVAFI